MSHTERLYYADSHLIEFEATVTGRSERVSGWTAVTLDRTAFYPTGGGQPSDTGTINGTRVVECVDDEGGEVWHVMQGNAPAIGSQAKGRIDWARRLDHMQQHTGQHILSQAFISLFKAPTHSFRVLENACEIDVEITNPCDELIERAVELANNVIWEDRPIWIRQVTAAEAAELPLRKDPARQGDLRLIEIDGFDLTPCGGTHAFRTGEVGMIAVRSWERAKGLVRIEWVAGGRALADYRRANKTARAVAALFSSARDDAAVLAEKLLDENKALLRKMKSLEEIACAAEAEQLCAGSLSTSAGATIVSNIFDNRDADSLRHLAHAIVARPATIALLGSRDGETARLVFARSADVLGDMNSLMRAACEVLEGRGGGRPDLAQGGGKNLAGLDEAIAQAQRKLANAESVP